MTLPPVVLDHRGDRCPIPVIALGRYAASTVGGFVELLADDPAARYDVPAWCRMRAATLLSTVEETGEDAAWTRYLIRLPDAPANAPGAETNTGSPAT